MNAWLRFGLGFMLLAGLVGINAWAFAHWAGTSYFDWYLANGSKIGLLTALVSLSWGDLNRHVGLISAHPLHFIGANLQLLGLAMFDIGALFRRDPNAARRSSLFDECLAVAIVAGVVIALVPWLLIVVPMQYFVHLVCGAPGRVFAASNRRVAAWFSNGTQLETRVLRVGEEPPEGSWVANIASKPVTVTGIFASILFAVLNELL